MCGPLWLEKCNTLSRYRREREREELHLSSHTRLVQVLPGRPRRCGGRQPSTANPVQAEGSPAPLSQRSEALDPVLASGLGLSRTPPQYSTLPSCHQHTEPALLVQYFTPLFPTNTPPHAWRSCRHLRTSCVPPIVRSAIIVRRLHSGAPGSNTPPWRRVAARRGGEGGTERERAVGGGGPAGPMRPGAWAPAGAAGAAGAVGAGGAVGALDPDVLLKEVRGAPGVRAGRRGRHPRGAGG